MWDDDPPHTLSSLGLMSEPGIQGLVRGEARSGLGRLGYLAAPDWAMNNQLTQADRPASMWVALVNPYGPRTVPYTVHASLRVSACRHIFFKYSLNLFGGG